MYSTFSVTIFYTIIIYFQIAPQFENTGQYQIREETLITYKEANSLGGITAVEAKRLRAIANLPRIDPVDTTPVPVTRRQALCELKFN